MREPRALLEPLCSLFGPFEMRNGQVRVTEAGLGEGLLATGSDLHQSVAPGRPGGGQGRVQERAAGGASARGGNGGNGGGGKETSGGRTRGQPATSEAYTLPACIRHTL